MVDAEEIRLELAIASAARVVYGCMCNCGQDDPESIRAMEALAAAVFAAEEYANPPAVECVLLEGGG